MLAILATLLFASITLAGLAFAQRGWQQEEQRATIERRLETVGAPKAANISVFKDQRLSAIGFLNRFLGTLTSGGRLVKMIRQAGLSKRVGEVVLYIPLLASLGFLTVEVLGYGHALAVVASLVGAMTPLFVINRMRRKRSEHFSEQLPDALDLIGSALRAGHALAGGFTIVAEEFPDPIAQEFRDVTDELRVGLTLREALNNMNARIEDRNLPILVVAILIAQETGGNMAEVLSNTSETIRERFRMLRDMDAMTAQGRMSGGVLTALPIMVGGLMYFVNGKYFDPMITTTAGNYMLAYCAVSIILAHFTIKKIVKIDV